MSGAERKARIFLYPPLSDQADIDKIVSRMAWYFWPHRARLESVVACIPHDRLELSSLAPDLDPRIAALLDDARAKFRLVSQRDLEVEIIAGDPARDVFLIWDIRCEATLSGELAGCVKAYQKHGGFYRVDPERTRMEGSFLLWAGLNKFCDVKSLTTEHAARFGKLASEVGHHRRAYVFGTGPSFSEFVRTHDFSDGLCIIANSIVKDKEALAILRPRIICAADPIYHAGVSSYAGAFREELIDALESTGAWFVCPMRDFPIYDALLPERHRARIVAIPFNDKKAPPVDLTSQFYLRPFPNVLTLGLLPLASTFAETISIVGCDGRRILDDSFFWSHDKKVQFNDKMSEIQAAHPAFFKIDYNDYYMDHCRDLEVVISELEAAGRKVQVETASLIPALAHRARNAKEPEPLACLAMIDPDAKDDWGHFLAYDKRIGDTTKKAGVSFALICRSELVERYRPDSADFFLPVFSVNSWTIGNKAPAKRIDVLTFARELDAALESLEASVESGSICLFFYVGSVEAAEVIEHLLMYRERVSAVVNLFWSYNFDQADPGYSSVWKPLTARQANARRIRVMHSTHQIAEEFRRDWGVDLQVLAHPSTTFSDEDAGRLARLPAKMRTSRSFGEGGLNVLFPGGARKEKGFVLSVEAAACLAAVPGFKPQLRARLDKVSGPELQRAFDALDKTGIEIIDGDLSDSQFIEMVANADIVVIPYFGEAFRRRTSGILVDAMLLGKPVVVLSGTWLADIVAEEKTGAVAEPTAQGVVDAVRSLAEKADQYFSSIEAASGRYLETNSWSALFASVVKLSGLALSSSENRRAERSALKANFATLAEHARTLEARPATGESAELRGRILALSGALLLGSPNARIDDLRALVAQAPDTPAARHAAAVIDFTARKTGLERNAP